MTHDGVARSFQLFVPGGISRFSGPRPLIVVLHGGGGSAREVVYSTRGRFDQLAAKYGFIVAYPNAIGRIWDTGSGKISSALKPRRDDDGFLKSMIDVIAARYPVDRTRIFATGISRGGMESYAFACNNPGLIRAIAPVAMTLPTASVTDCSKGEPLGFLLIHGTADPIVPYGGGPITIGRRSRDQVESADKTMAIFSKRNHCTSSNQSRTGAVLHIDLQGCTVPTGHYRVEGGGHGWPSGRKVIPGGRAGPINTDIVAADEVWAFFSRF
jgi:polyhydroxybutyrate depolymerase